MGEKRKPKPKGWGLSAAGKVFPQRRRLRVSGLNHRHGQKSMRSGRIDQDVVLATAADQVGGQLEGEQQHTDAVPHVIGPVVALFHLLALKSHQSLASGRPGHGVEASADAALPCRVARRRAGDCGTRL